MGTKATASSGPGPGGFEPEFIPPARVDKAIGVFAGVPNQHADIITWNLLAGQYKVEFSYDRINWGPLGPVRNFTGGDLIYATPTRQNAVTEEWDDRLWDFRISRVD